MGHNKNKTLIIGIDAGCWEYIDPLINQGRLPNLQKLISEGVRGYLESTLPPITSVAWSSIITGVNPSKHGIYDWGQKEADSTEMSPVSSENCSGIPFWEYLNKSNIRVGLFNVPMIYPAKEIDGFMLTGLPDTPQFNEKAVFPYKLHGELSHKLCKFYVSDMIELLKEKGIEEYFKKYKKVNQLNTQIAIDLIKEFDVNVFLINYMITDHMNHFAEDFSYIEKAYENVDLQLGVFKNNFPDANFIVFSDHGSRRVHKTFLVNKWLYNQGLLKLKQKTYDELGINDLEGIIRLIFEKKKYAKGLKEKLVRKAIKYMLYILKPFVWRQLWSELQKKFPALTDIFLNMPTCDLTETRVFCSQVGNLYFDKLSSDYSILEDVKSKLLKLRSDESGDTIFCEVYEAAELYRGDKISDAPELIMYFGDSVYDLDARIYNFAKDSDGVFIDRKKLLGNAGDHTKTGVFIMSGGGFVNMPAEHRFDASVLDLVPTLFALHEVPISKDFDGKVLWDTFSIELKREKIAQYQESVMEKKSIAQKNPEDIEKIISGLKALGYL